MNNTFKISHVLLLLITILLLLNCEDKPEPGKHFLEGEQIQGTEDFVPLHLFGETRKFDVSPDGKSMVYTGRVTISDDRRGLWEINLETGEKRRLLEDGLSADWSPDGKWIAFDKGWQIFKVRPDGTDLTQLTFKGANLNPDWSPDSQQLLYNNIDCGSQAEPIPPNSCGVLKMNSDGEDRIIIVDYYSKPLWINSKTFFVSGGLLFDTSGVEKYRVDFNKSYRTADLSYNGTRIIMDNTEGIYYMNSDGTGYQ
jgi:Tol biopolymer transport system component